MNRPGAAEIELITKFGPYDEKTNTLYFDSGHYEYFENHEVTNPMDVVTEPYDIMMDELPDLMRSLLRVAVREKDGTIWEFQCTDIRTRFPEKNLSELKKEGGSLSAEFVGDFMIMRKKPGMKEEPILSQKNRKICGIPVMLDDGSFMTNGKSRHILSLRDDGASVADAYSVSAPSRHSRRYVKTPADLVRETVTHGLMKTTDDIRNLFVATLRNGTDFTRANVMRRSLAYLDRISSDVSALIEKSKLTRTQDTALVGVVRILDREVYADPSVKERDGGRKDMVFYGSTVQKESASGAWTDIANTLTDFMETERTGYARFVLDDPDAPAGLPYRVLMNSADYAALNDTESILVRKTDDGVAAVREEGGSEGRSESEYRMTGCYRYRNERRNFSVGRKEPVTPVFTVDPEGRKADVSEPLYVTPDKFFPAYVIGVDSIDREGRMITDREGLIHVLHEGRDLHVQPSLLEGKTVFSLVSSYQLNEPVMAALHSAQFQGKTDPTQFIKTGNQTGQNRRIFQKDGSGNREKGLLPVVTGLYGEGIAKSMCSVSEHDGRVERIDEENAKVYVRSTGDGELYEYSVGLAGDVTSRKDTPDMKIRVKEGDEIRKGDVIADGIFTENGRLSMSVALNTVNISGGGNTLEDCAVISESAAAAMSSEITVRYSATVAKSLRGNGNGPEFLVSAKKPGDRLYFGDVLFTKSVPPENGDMTPEDRMNLTSPGADYAEENVRFEEQAVTRREWEKNEGAVIKEMNEWEDGKGTRHYDYVISYPLPLRRADKIADEFGNKKLISRVLPDESMPKDSDGNRVDILMGPCSNVSRKNTGADFSARMERYARKLGLSRLVLTAYTPEPRLRKFIHACAKHFGELGKTPSITWENGEVTIGIGSGYVPIFRLNRESANAAGYNSPIPEMDGNRSKTADRQKFIEEARGLTSEENIRNANAVERMLTVLTGYERVPERRPAVTRVPDGKIHE